MNDYIGKKIEISPRLIQRARGGWLAVTPDNARLRLGVTAPTENEAREEFSRAIERWTEILAT